MFADHNVDFETWIMITIISISRYHSASRKELVPQPSLTKSRFGKTFKGSLGTRARVITRLAVVSGCGASRTSPALTSCFGERALTRSFACACATAPSPRAVDIACTCAFPTQTPFFPLTIDKIQMTSASILYTLKTDYSVDFETWKTQYIVDFEIWKKWLHRRFWNLEKRSQRQFGNLEKWLQRQSGN